MALNGNPIYYHTSGGNYDKVDFMPWQSKVHEIKLTPEQITELLETGQVDVADGLSHLRLVEVDPKPKPEIEDVFLREWMKDVRDRLARPSPFVTWEKDYPESPSTQEE